MRKNELTEFGKEVKLELLLRGETQEWLARQVKDRSGKYVDSAYIYKILSGERNAPEIKAHIRAVLDLPAPQ